MTTVHILTLHSVLISPSNFCTQQTPKISQHETSQSSTVSVNKLSLLYCNFL